jgi:hypothetical protein
MAQQHDLSKLSCHVEVVHHSNHRTPLCRKASHESQNHLLVPDIQGGGRFVEQDERGILSEDSRKGRPLAFAAGKARHVATLQPTEVESTNSGVNRGLILRRSDGWIAAMGIPAHTHHLLNGERNVLALALAEHRAASSQIPYGHP